MLMYIELKKVESRINYLLKTYVNSPQLTKKFKDALKSVPISDFVPMEDVAKAKADTVRKMQELIYEGLDISVEGYSTEEVKSDVRDMVYQIAKKILEGDNEN